MRAVLDPSVPVVYQEAVLWQDDQAVAHTTVKCVDDHEGGYRPAEDIRFELKVACAPTHATICGRTFSIRNPPNLDPTDTYTIEWRIALMDIVNLFRDQEI